VGFGIPCDINKSIDLWVYLTALFTRVVLSNGELSTEFGMSVGESGNGDVDSEWQCVRSVVVSCPREGHEESAQVLRPVDRNAWTHDVRLERMCIKTHIIPIAKNDIMLHDHR
jgi:hypothetical protein